MNRNIILDKCGKCGGEFIAGGVYISYSHHKICWKCYREWCNDGYYKMWCTLINADNIELADKFMLDYLGQLGLSDE